MRQHLPLLLALLASSLTTRAVAQAPTQAEYHPPQLQELWQREYEHGITGHDSFAALDVAADGAIFVAGSSLGLNGSYTYEIVTLKYAADGTRLWERRFDSPGSGFNDVAVDVEVSVNGDVIVLGQGPGSSGNQDIITLCYDAQGGLKWQAVFDNNWSDGATALATSSDASIYVLGGTYFAGSVSDVALIKYDAFGVLQWERFFHGGWGTDVGVGLALDPLGDVLIGGYSIQAPGGTNFDWLALKYDASGNLLWSATRAGAAAGWPDYCWGMNADGAGDLILTGYLVNTQGVQDFTTMKFSGAGQFLWSRTLGLATGGGQVVVSDDARRVFVAGASHVVAYDSQGALHWQSSFTPPGLSNSGAKAIALDPAGRLVVAGTGYHPVNGVQLLTTTFDARGNMSDWDVRSGAVATGGLLAPSARRVYLCGALDNGHDNDGLLIRFTLLR